MGFESDMAARVDSREELERLLGRSMNPKLWSEILTDIKLRCREIDRYTAKLERENRKQADKIVRLKERVRIVEALNRKRR